MRLAVARHQLSKLHRAVMLAPPNRGTYLAKFSVGAFDRLFPVVKELSESPDALPSQLETPDNLEVGVIAAKSDFIVSEANTHLAEQQDHCVMPTSHFKLPEHPETIRRCLNFLSLGSFRGPQQKRRAA